MSVLSRDEKKEILQHLTQNIAQFDVDSPQHKALTDQIGDDLDTFLSIDVADIPNWTYSHTGDNNKTTKKKLMLAQISHMRHLVNYFKVVIAENNGDLHSVDEWKSFNNTHFIQYMANPRVAPVTPIAIDKNSPNPDSTVNFQRGNKRDISVYPVLNDIKHYSSWKTTFDALAIKDGFGPWTRTIRHQQTRRHSSRNRTIGYMLVLPSS